VATIPSILAGRIFGTAGATQAYYLGGGTTLSQIGPDVAAALNTQPAANASFGNGPVIKFRGTRFCQDGSTGSNLRIRRYNAYSNVWEPVFNIAGPVISTTLLSPLCAFQESNGVSGIFFVVWTTTSSVSIVKTTDGVIWTATALGVITITANLGRSHMHRNKLVVTANVSGNAFATFIFDPVGLTFSTTSPPSDGTTAAAVGIGCIPAITTFNNRLFMLFTRDSTPGYSVALASNGVNVNTFVGAQTLNINQATTGLPTSGTVNVNTGSGYQVVTYTGLGATSFTGCTSTGAGVLATSGLLSSGNLAAAQLYELVGGVWTSIVAVGTNSGATSIANITPGSHALLPIGSTKLVAIIKTDFPNVGGILAIGTRAYDLTPSGATFTSAEVTSTLIPATLRTQGGGATTDQRWSCFVDDVTVPGTPAVFVFLWGDDQATGTISYYEYVNSTTILAPGSLGPAANVLLPYCTYGGGAYVAADQDLDVWLTRTNPVLAGTRLSYLASGLFTAASVRNSVAYATTGILPGTVVASGSGVGKSLGTALTGALTVDGVTFTTALNIGMRVLVKNQAAPADNGIYTLTLATGSSYTLVRATDFDQPAEVYNGASVRVGGGNTLAGTRWMQTTANPITVDTTGLTFTQVTTDAGLLFRASCRLATTAALPACTPAGSGVGKTLTANAIGILSVDSTNAVLGDRIVVKNQATTADNGLYTVTTEGTAGVAFVLTRATDFDAVGQNEVMPGAYTYVTGGSSNLDTYFEMTTDGQITMESTALAFTSRMPVSWKMFYNTAENTDMTQGTLFGTATGGPSLRATNQVNRVAADGVEPSTADWRAGTGGDGLQSGQAVTAFQRLNV
jgi:hypothetical protein